MRLTWNLQMHMIISMEIHMPCDACRKEETTISMQVKCEHARQRCTIRHTHTPHKLREKAGSTIHAHCCSKAPICFKTIPCASSLLLPLFSYRFPAFLSAALFGLVVLDLQRWLSGIWILLADRSVAPSPVFILSLRTKEAHQVASEPLIA